MRLLPVDTITWRFSLLILSGNIGQVAFFQSPATFVAAPMMALTIWAVPGSRPLRLLISASFRAPATAPEVKPAPVIRLMSPAMAA